MKTALIFVGLLWTAPIYAAVSTGAVALDPSGNVWRTGKNPFLATTPNAAQKTAAGSICATQQISPFDKPTSVYCDHAYITEQDPSGNILYATYLTGSNEDGGTAITTDAHGNIYVAGFTYSSDFPATQNAAQKKNAGPLTPTIIPEGLGPFGPVLVGPGGDVFVAKFAPDGTLIYATLLGGSGEDIPTRIGVDSAGSVYVAGTTTSRDFPVTSGALARQALSASFFARLSPDGSAWTYSTGCDPTVQSFFVNDAGDAYLTGFSPPPSGAGNGGPYVTGIDTASARVLFSSFLPDLNPSLLGSSGAAIAPAASGELFAGVSPAVKIPTAPVYEPPFFPLGPSYLLRLSADGSRILSETDIGETQFDSVQLDGSGNLYAFGHGTGTLPVGPAPLLASPCLSSGGSFVIEPSASGDVVAATYLRQGDDSAIRFTAPGHFEAYRGASGTAATLDLTVPAAPNFGCVDNLGSGEAGAGLAPGEIFVIYGMGIGPSQAAVATPDSSGLYPTTLGGVQVTLNGTAVPLLYAQAGEIHGVAPFSLGTVSTVGINYQGQPVATPLDMPWTQANPGILVLPGGQAAAVNQDGTVNAPSNPAKLGSVISIYATGTGYLEAQLPDGSITPIPPPYITLEFAPQVRFANLIGSVLWSGSAPGLIAGVTQINVRLPAALPEGTNLSAVPVILNASEVYSPSAPISVQP